MSTSISSIGNSDSGGFDPSRMTSMAASRMMNDLDPNHTGKVTRDQFISGLTAKGVSTAEAAKMYDAIDTQKTGSITKSDIETAIKNGNLKPPPGAVQAGLNSAGGTDNTSLTFAVADTNKDGVVSVEEAAIYAVSHPTEVTNDSNQTDLSNLGQNVDELV